LFLTNDDASCCCTSTSIQNTSAISNRRPSVEIRHNIPIVFTGIKNLDDMKTVLARLGVADNVPLEKFKKGTAILMILFFLVFGVASLFVLLNSAA
jgi:hypothetical protein